MGGKTTYSIGEVAKALNIKPHLVRYYCEKHNIKPEEVTPGGHTRFTAAQISELNEIKIIRKQGWPAAIEIIRKYKRLKFKAEH